MIDVKLILKGTKNPFPDKRLSFAKLSFVNDIESLCWARYRGNVITRYAFGNVEYRGR